MPFLWPNQQHQRMTTEAEVIPNFLVNCNNRVATNVEYSGISLNMVNSGNSVQPQGKIVTNRVFF